MRKKKGGHPLKERARKKHSVLKQMFLALLCILPRTQLQPIDQIVFFETRPLFLDVVTLVIKPSLFGTDRRKGYLFEISNKFLSLKYVP